MEDLLKNYNNFKAEIKIKEYQIYNIEQEEVSVGSAVLDGMPKPTGYYSSNIENQIARKIDKVEQLKVEIKELQKKIDMIDSLIDTLKEPYRKVIKDYYINKKSALTIAYDIQREEKSVFRILRRSIDIMDSVFSR